MPMGIANSYCRATMNMLQLSPCLKKYNSFTSPKPNATVSDYAQCTCVTADPLAYNTVQGPCSSMYSNEDTYNVQILMTFSFLLLFLLFSF